MRIPPLPHHLVVLHAARMVADRKKMTLVEYLDGVALRGTLAMWNRQGDRCMRYAAMDRIIQRCQADGVVFTEHGFAAPWLGYVTVIDADGALITERKAG